VESVIFGGLSGGRKVRSLKKKYSHHSSVKTFLKADEADRTDIF
jgi:hypothetical protein